MSTLFITHPACLDHLTPAGHPERPDRLRAVEHALEAEKFQAMARVSAPLAPLDIVALCHPMDYIEEIRDASPKDGLVHIDADTSMSPGTFEAALRAVGGGMYAVDEVMAKRAANAFVATRPPGHHAETARPMGFCLFDNAAIAARYAQKKHGIARAAIVDFDVHHGNGSQEIFWSDKSVMYCSTHQMPLFPGTGATGESGDHNTIVNAPLRPGDGGELAGGREPGAAAAGEPRCGDHLDQLPRPTVGRRPVGAQVGVQVHSLQQPGRGLGARGAAIVPRQGVGGGHRGAPRSAAWRPAGWAAASSSAVMTRRKRGIAVVERRSRTTTAAATAARQSTVTASSQPD